MKYVTNGNEGLIATVLYLSSHFTVVQVHQLVGVRARLLHLHGGIRELGAHEQAVVQVVGAAPPAVARLGDFTRDGAAGAHAQVSRRAGPGDGVADGGRRQGVHKSSLSRTCWRKKRVECEHPWCSRGPEGVQNRCLCFWHSHRSSELVMDSQLRKSLRQRNVTNT